MIFTALLLPEYYQPTKLTNHFTDHVTFNVTRTCSGPAGDPSGPQFILGMIFQINGPNHNSGTGANY